MQQWGRGGGVALDNQPVPSKLLLKLVNSSGHSLIVGAMREKAEGERRKNTKES